MSKNIQFIGNYIIKGKIECLTGLHIGGSKEKLEIGGVDSPVIRQPNSKYPYIPGSSLKGKMRHLLEFSTGAVTNPHKCKLGNVSQDEKIVRIFGIGADDDQDKDNNKQKEEDKDLPCEEKLAKGIGTKRVGLGRLIVRDCKPDKATISMWENMDSELLYTEYKPENTIDRLTAAANPRFIERVVEGSKFDFEMVYGIYKMYTEENEIKEADKDLENLLWAMRLLEDATLGKSGSRGYGHIKFHVATPVFVKADDYRTGEDSYLKAEKPVEELDLQPLSKITLKYTTS